MANQIIHNHKIFKVGEEPTEFVWGMGYIGYYVEFDPDKPYGFETNISSQVRYVPIAERPFIMDDPTWEKWASKIVNLLKEGSSK